MSDRVVYLRSTAIVDLNFEIKIPKTPVDTTKKDMTIPGGGMSNLTFDLPILQIYFLPILCLEARGVIT